MSETLTEAASPERYRFDQQIVRLPVGNDQELLYCDLTGATSLVPRHEVRILQACKTFASLDVHARKVCSELGLGALHVAAVAQQLSAFAQKGLLLPHSLLLERCRKGTAIDTGGDSKDDTISAIAYLGVPTRNRPDYLKQCLDSYVISASRSKRKIVFVVADQSNRQNRDANAQVLECIKTTFAVEIWHIDLEAANTLVSRLSQISQVPEPIVNFALLGAEGADFAGGANRNLLLLASVGQMMLQADQDSVCRLMPAPDMRPGLVLSSAIDPADFWFPTEEELHALEEHFVDEDVFLQHERFLGRTVSQCLRESAGNVDIDAANSSFYRRLDGEQAKILVTNCGLVGQSGRAEGEPIIVLDGEKRKRLIVSEQHYRYVQKKQRLLRGVTQATITEGAVCFGFNLGIDNREIFPPFMPIMRGEDWLLTPMLRAATSNSFLAILPWLVYHAGAARKNRGHRLQAQMVAPLGFSDIISLILQSHQGKIIKQQTPGRLQEISDLLVEIGSLPGAEFERVMRTLWWQTASIQMFKLETALKLHCHQPDYWSQDIIDYMQQYRQSFVDPRSIVASDVIKVFGQGQAFEKQKELIRQFGQLIGSWAELRQAAAKLRQSEGSLGRRI